MLVNRLDDVRGVGGQPALRVPLEHVQVLVLERLHQLQHVQQQLRVAGLLQPLDGVLAQLRLLEVGRQQLQRIAAVQRIPQAQQVERLPHLGGRLPVDAAQKDDQRLLVGAQVEAEAPDQVGLLAAGLVVGRIDVHDLVQVVAITAMGAWMRVRDERWVRAEKKPQYLRRIGFQFPVEYIGASGPGQTMVLPLDQIVLVT